MSALVLNRTSTFTAIATRAWPTESTCGINQPRTGSGRSLKARVWEDRKERVGQPGVQVLVGFILATLLSVSWSLGRREDRLDQTTAYALACCATLLVSPLSWGHYYMAEAPAVLFVTLWLLRTGRSIIVGIVAVVPPVLCWSYYVAMPYTGGLGLLGLGTTAWFLGVCGWIVGHEVAVSRAATKGPAVEPKTTRRSRRRR